MSEEPSRRDLFKTIAGGAAAAAGLGASSAEAQRVIRSEADPHIAEIDMGYLKKMGYKPTITEKQQENVKDWIRQVLIKNQAFLTESNAIMDKAKADRAGEATMRFEIDDVALSDLKSMIPDLSYIDVKIDNVTPKSAEKVQVHVTIAVKDKSPDADPTDPHFFDFAEFDYRK